MNERSALVIDDSRAMRMLLGDPLKSLGYNVSEATDGRDALDRLGQLEAPPRVILVDWNMPVMDGMSFIQQVRQQPRFSDTTLVVVTSETAMDQMTHALAQGADEYLMKPFGPEALLSKLELLGLATT